MDGGVGISGESVAFIREGSRRSVTPSTARGLLLGHNGTGEADSSLARNDMRGPYLISTVASPFAATGTLTLPAVMFNLAPSSSTKLHNLASLKRPVGSVIVA